MCIRDRLVTGQPVYVDDVTPRDCLCVKLLRSPHANAIVKSINKTAAMKVPGMEAIFTWAVSYTHLDVYKRQVQETARN